MKPIDFRNAQYFEIKQLITRVRAEVLEAWRQHGPCTTKQLATRSGISILTLRPRTTELYQIGFVEMAPYQGKRTEGTYRALDDAQHLAWFKDERFKALEKAQMNLPLK